MDILVGIICKMFRLCSSDAICTHTHTKRLTYIHESALKQHISTVALMHSLLIISSINFGFKIVVYTYTYTNICGLVMHLWHFSPVQRRQNIKKHNTSVTSSSLKWIFFSKIHKKFKHSILHWCSIFIKIAAVCYFKVSTSLNWKKHLHILLTLKCFL